MGLEGRTHEGEGDDGFETGGHGGGGGGGIGRAAMRMGMGIRLLCEACTGV